MNFSTPLQKEHIYQTLHFQIERPQKKSFELSADSLIIIYNVLSSGKNKGLNRSKKTWISTPNFLSFIPEQQSFHLSLSPFLGSLFYAFEFKDNA